MEEFNVLSLFDGMSCAQIALNRIGRKPTNYYASEVDKHAIKVTMSNYPGTNQLGDVRNVDISTLPKIHLLCGGSPCQSFSFAGKRKGMSTKCEQEILDLETYLALKEQGFEFEGQSYLFWEYIRILNDVRKTNPDVLFLLENVLMSEKWEKVLTRAIGINPIMINAALVSAQSRKRLYWTNLGAEPDGLFGDLVCKIEQPKDRGILLKDVLQDGANPKYYLSDKMIEYFNTRAANFNNGKVNIRSADGKSSALTASYSSCDISDNFIMDAPRAEVEDKYYLSEKALEYIDRDKRNLAFRMDETDDKSGCLTAVFQKQIPYNQIVVHNMQPRCGDPKKGGTGHLTESDGKTYCLDTGNTNAVEIVAMRGRDPENPSNREKGLNTEQRLEPRKDGKTNCLTTVQKDNLLRINGEFKENYFQYDINGLGHNSQDQRAFYEDGKAGTLDTGSASKQKVLLSDDQEVSGADFRTDEGLRIRDNGKSGTLAARARQDESCGQMAVIGSRIRRLTPVECERLQCVPDNYTNFVSDSQRYRMLGNGWNIEVICHIFRYIKL